METVRLRIIVGYKPPYLPNHPVSTTVSLGEFSDYLESIVIPSKLLLISGDFNIHVDVPTDADGIRFRDLLDYMGLTRKEGMKSLRCLVVISMDPSRV